MQTGMDTDETRPATGRRGTRARMVNSAAALLRERSAAGVTVDAVLARSGAPRGSVYHHFPGGRDQIIREAVELAGAHVTRLIHSTSARDPSDVVVRFLKFWQRVLRSSDYLAGCPVVALTVELHEGQDAAMQLVRDVFARWHTELQQVLTTSGVPAERAGSLSTLTIAAAEGAVLLARAQRSTEPLNDICTELQLLLTSAVVR